MNAFCWRSHWSVVASYWALEVIGLTQSTCSIRAHNFSSLSLGFQNGALYGKKWSDLFEFLDAFVWYELGFLWFAISSKRRIKAWGWISIICWTCLELPTFSPNMDPWTLYLLPKELKPKKNPKYFSNILFLYILEFRMSISYDFFEKMGPDKWWRSI